MAGLDSINPFSRRESHSSGEVWAYKALTVITWLLAVITTAYYSVNGDGHHHSRSIWGQNYWFHTAFALNSVITSIYWVVLFLSQIGYVWHLFSSNSEYVTSAANVGSHFIFNNLLHFAWVLLFVRNHFVWSEIILIINFFNLSSLYFRHPLTTRGIHIPVVSGPLVWTWVALFWNGAIAVHATSVVARIFANVFVWSFLLYGLFFVLVYKDYTVGYELSVLTAALGVGQFLRQIVAFQWIFAFTIMAVLFVTSTLIAVPAILGKDISFRREAPSGDAERAPLLQDN